jgi:DNA-binding NarL/FixJ family response regulator
MSPMFRDLITGLMVGQRSLDVVDELDTRDGLEEKLTAIAPDLILIGLGKKEADDVGLLLARLLPNAKVIAFSSDGRRAFVHRMQPQRTVLLDVSPQMIIDAILGL